MKKRTKNKNKKMKILASEIGNRMKLAKRLSGNGNKIDVYEECGYLKDPRFDDYYSRFRRQGLGKTVVCAYPDETWQVFPDIRENENEDGTEFEAAVKKLFANQSIRLWHNFRRIDRLAGIGRYAVLLVGFDDGRPLEEEVGNATEITYLQPYLEPSARISEYESDPSNPRFGLPLFYQLEKKTGRSTVNFRVHYSRLIHVVDNADESDIFGAPRLEPCLNECTNVEKIIGSSSEGYWRSAFPGHAFIAKEDAEFDKESLEAMDEEMTSYYSTLQRFLRLQNVDVKSLSPQMTDVTSTLEANLKIISATTRIPLRILIGSERGELASGQDQENWNTQIDIRRKTYAEAVILRPFIDMCIEAKILPEVQEYTVSWPDIGALSDKAQADISKTRMDALKSYVSTPGSEEIVPPIFFLTYFMYVPQKTAEAFLSSATARMKEEESRALEDEEAVRKMIEAEEDEEDEEDEEEVGDV